MNTRHYNYGNNIQQTYQIRIYLIRTSFVIDYIRIFDKVTISEEEIIGYRQQLHAEFYIVFAHFQISEQRVAGQYRVI